jgi:hypothetical protein
MTRALKKMKRENERERERETGVEEEEQKKGKKSCKNPGVNTDQGERACPAYSLSLSLFIAVEPTLPVLPAAV